MLTRPVFVALAILMGAAHAQTSTTPALPAALAYVAPDGTLVTQQPGSDPQPLSRDGARYAFPAWSPGGQRVAVIERQGTRARAVIFTPGSAGGERRVLLDDPERAVIYLDWRDDGDAVYLLTNHPNGRYALIEATDAGTRELATGAPLFWHEAPNGMLAVHLQNADGDQNFLLDPGSGDVTPLDPPGPYRSPAVSTSGRWLAGSVRPFGGPRIDVQRLPLETGDDTRRQLDYSGLTAFAWSPQGTDRLAVIRPLVNAPHAFGPLGVLNAEDGLYEPVTDASVLAFWWSPNGEQMMFIASDPPGNDTVASRAAPQYLAAATQAILPETHVSQPQAVQQSATRFRLGYANISGNEEPVWLGGVRPSARFLSEQLPFFDQYDRSHQAWSPDGRMFVLPVTDPSGAARLLFAEPDGGGLVMGPYGSMPSWAPVAP
jgi:hypothetical protein